MKKNQTMFLPYGTVPWIIIKKPQKIYDTILETLLHAEIYLKTEGYYDDITLCINNEKFDLFDDITKYRLRKEEFFKLNIHITETIMHLYGFTRNNRKDNKIIGTMCVIFDD